MSNFFSDEYSSPQSSSEKEVATKKSTTKDLLKESIDDESLKKYGLSKPIRMVIRAKVTDDPS